LTTFQPRTDGSRGCDVQINDVRLNDVQINDVQINDVRLS
jgi:hypothetical protein